MLWLEMSRNEAHDTGKPLTGATDEDYQKVASKVPVIRYMANVVLENVRVTFDAAIEREVAKTAVPDDPAAVGE